MIFSHEQVKKYLPHRDPFLFVESISEIDLSAAAKVLVPNKRKVKDLVGSSVTGVTSINEKHPIFAGHFPGNPILPGVVHVETMAQVACFLMTALKNEPVGAYSIDVALLGIDKARFKIAIKPNFPLTVVTKLLKVREPYMIFEGTIFYQDKKCSECEFMASFKFI